MRKYRTKSIILCLLFLLVGFLFHGNVEAKLLPRFQKVSRPAGKQVASGLVVSAKLRSDRRAIFVYFSNLNKISALTYTLMYQTNGKDEGVSGTLDVASANTAQRELLFGTCSSGVCRYHENLSNMRLEITSTLPSGKQTIKRFKVRI